VVTLWLRPAQHSDELALIEYARLPVVRWRHPGHVPLGGAVARRTCTGGALAILSKRRVYACAVYNVWLSALDLHIDDRAYLEYYAEERYNGDVRAAVRALIVRARWGDAAYMARYYPDIAQQPAEAAD
jgi:hypothetical protein